MLSHYTRANAGEVLPDPVSPLSWTLCWEKGLVKGCRDGFISFGVVDYDEYATPEKPEAFGLFGGYFYNPLALARLMGARMPGASPSAVDDAYFDARDEVPPYKEEPWHQSERHAAKLGETMAWVMSGVPVPELDADRDLAAQARRERPDLASLPDASLLARARSFPPYLQEMFEHHVWTSLGASLGPGAIGAITAAIDEPEAAVALLAGIGDVDSAAPSWALWDLSRLVAGSSELTGLFDGGTAGLLEHLAEEAAAGASDAQRFLTDFDEFVVAFGSRGPNEWDLRAETWETHPQLALAAIERMRLAPDSASPRHGHAAVVAERERLTPRIRELVAGDPETLATLDAAMKSAAVWLAGRERTRPASSASSARSASACWSWHGAWWRVACSTTRTRSSCSWPTSWTRSGSTPSASPRSCASASTTTSSCSSLSHRSSSTPWCRRSARGSGAPTAASPRSRRALCSPAPPAAAARPPAGPGCSTDPSDPSALEPGDVLVAYSTDPAWTPLFVPAGAVVTSVGALGSHTMIVSRELGIPCVVSVEDATLRIPDGAMVTVDGSAGTVTVH